MADAKLQAIVEALLFVSDQPLGLNAIQEVLKVEDPGVTLDTVRGIVMDLQGLYDQGQRGFQVQEIASGYQLKTRPEHAPYLSKLFEDQLKERLSMPALETLAIIAYKQPVTRAEVEAIRGVNVDGIIKTLMDRDLIRIVGKKDIAGHPFLFGTTKEFLMHFGLKDLQALPNIQEFKEAMAARESHLAQHRQAAGAGGQEVLPQEAPSENEKAQTASAEN